MMCRRRHLSFTAATAVLMIVGVAFCCCGAFSTVMALSSSSSTDVIAPRRSSSSSKHRCSISSADDVDKVHHIMKHDNRDDDRRCNCDRRRNILTIFTCSIMGISTTTTSASHAIAADIASTNDFEAPMNGFTRQIRTSVVRGAQVIDSIDSKWERFSDDFGLGDKRNQPKRNVIDAGGNQRSKEVVRSQENNEGVALDQGFAEDLLHQCDEAFLTCLRKQNVAIISSESLRQQIDGTTTLLRKSFFKTSTPPNPQEEYNFNCYVHFRVYNEILVKNKVFFPSFQKEFEARLGQLLLQSALKEQPSLLSSDSTITKATTLTEKLVSALTATDNATTLLRNKGMIDSWERSIPPDDDIEDWAGSTATKSLTDKNNFYVSSDVTFSLALNKDITLNSQLLLQELGYRLYPSFGRILVQNVVLQCFGNENVNVYMDDYYMDTSYNSNPDLFEVKQILLNIVLERG